jgi:hypothetical protein
VGEALGQHRRGDDDVHGGDVGPDRSVPTAAGDHLLETVADLRAQRDGAGVEADRSAVQREDELLAGRDCLVEKVRQRGGGRVLAGRGGLGVAQDKLVGALSQGGEQVRAR